VAPATTVDAAQPAAMRLAAAVLAAMATARIEVEGTGADELIHVPVKSPAGGRPPSRRA
ncbi:hypothetical protein O974_12810, partial [Mycobacterium avium 11-0986]